MNAVNCDGVMGKGIALLFKKVFPENFIAYRAACEKNEVKPGEMFVFATSTERNPRFIVNFPTKLCWQNKSRLEYIESGLADLVRVVQGKGIGSIAIPALGCGNGGLDWQQVLPLIERASDEVPNVKFLVYPPL